MPTEFRERKVSGEKGLTMPSGIRVLRHPKDRRTRPGAVSGGNSAPCVLMGTPGQREAPVDSQL